MQLLSFCCAPRPASERIESTSLVFSMNRSSVQVPRTMGQAAPRNAKRNIPTRPTGAWIERSRQSVYPEPTISLAAAVHLRGPVRPRARVRVCFVPRLCVRQVPATRVLRCDEAVFSRARAVFTNRSHKYSLTLPCARGPLPGRASVRARGTIGHRGGGG